MRRFGPSGSLKKKNNALEHTSAVTTKRSSDVRFNFNGILFSIEYFSACLPSLDRLENLRRLRVLLHRLRLGGSSACSLNSALSCALTPDRGGAESAPILL